MTEQNLAIQGWLKEIRTLGEAVDKAMDDPTLGDYARYVRIAPLVARMATFHQLIVQEREIEARRAEREIEARRAEREMERKRVS